MTVDAVLATWPGCAIARTELDRESGYLHVLLRAGDGAEAWFAVPMDQVVFGPPAHPPSALVDVNEPERSILVDPEETKAKRAAIRERLESSTLRAVTDDP